MNMTLRRTHLLFTSIFLGLAFLLACGGGSSGGYSGAGGGGGGGGSVAPVVNNSPAATTVIAGQTASFSVNASGTPTPSFQWETSHDGTTWTAIPGANSGSYSFLTAKTDNGVQFRAQVSNTAGSATSGSALLTVNWAPIYTVQCVNQSVQAPDPATFTVAVDANPAATYQWATSTDGVTWIDIPGATGLSVSTGPTDSSMNTLQYWATATNSVGSTISATAILYVNVASFDLTVSLGAGTTGTPSATATYPAGGTVNYSYSLMNGYQNLQVLLDGTLVAPAGSFTMNGAHSLVVGATPTTATSYTITAHAGIWGSISPNGPVTVASGGSQTFAINPDPGYIILDVQVDGVSVGAVASYSFTNVTANHSISATFTY
jgi:hypothetical protein